MKKKKSRTFLVIILTVIMTFAGLVPADVYAASEISDIVAGMSTEQKIAQCFMMDFRKWDGGSGVKDMTVLDDEVAEIIADYQFGAMILFAENIKETGETLDLTKALQRAAQKNGGLPLLIATDQEGGIVYRLGSGTALPGNMAVCATGDPENARKVGQIIGSELKSVGINTTLAPVLDVNTNANNPVIGLRSFSDDADTVGNFGKAYINGLKESDVIGCAKHYPGHGDTATDSHTGLPLVDKPLSELKNTELKPFQAAIDSGVDMIMTAHILYPQVDDGVIPSEKTGQNEMRPATLSYKFLKGIVRDDMGFSGVIITDAMNMEGVSNFFYEDQAALEALKAGADLVCMPVTGVYNNAELRDRIDIVISRIKDAVDSGELSEDRLNEAVTRILTLKKNRGILDYNEADYSKETAYNTVGNKEHRELERTIAASGVTLVRNDDYTLPYDGSKGSKILMMSPYDNESAQMVMGFNRAKEEGKLPSDAEVKLFCFQGYKGGIEGDLKTALDWADLVVIGSELYGTADMALDEGRWRSLVPQAVTEYCKSEGKKSVILSLNTPYDVQLYPDADAVLAVYGWVGSSVDVNEAIEKGITEAKDACGPNITAGVEVLFGVFDATGKLPVNIPVFDKTSKKYTDSVAYERGYGLNYVKLHKITYELNGGSYKGSTKDIVEEHREGTEIDIHEAPERDGYTFLYWKGSEYRPGDKYTVNEDHVLTAQWEKKSAPQDDPDEDDDPSDSEESKTADKTKKVRTGDDNDLRLWLTLMLISASAITGLFVMRRRKC